MRRSPPRRRGHQAPPFVCGIEGICAILRHLHHLSLPPLSSLTNCESRHRQQTRADSNKCKAGSTAAYLEGGGLARDNPLLEFAANSGDSAAADKRRKRLKAEALSLG